MAYNAQRELLLNEFCKKLNIEFNDKQLLNLAFIHTSFSYERKKNVRRANNERLEFLGDAVLSMAVCDYIYKKFPDMSEGDMTKLRASVVCEQALVKYANKISLGDYLLLGKGELASGGKKRNSILADALEAVLGAYYLDKGFDEAKKLSLFFLKEEIKAFAATNGTYDYKTKLQEIVQKDSISSVSYEMLKETGPDHNKTFEMAVLINDKTIAVGRGSSKKEAEQLAAKQAIKLFEN